MDHEELISQYKNKPERQHLLACVTFFGNDLGFLKCCDEGWKLRGEYVYGDRLLYRLLLHSRHKILSPSGKKPAPTSETEHWVQVKHG